MQLNTAAYRARFGLHFTQNSRLSASVQGHQCSEQRATCTMQAQGSEKGLKRVTFCTLPFLVQQPINSTHNFSLEVNMLYRDLFKFLALRSLSGAGQTTASSPHALPCRPLEPSALPDCSVGGSELQ
jgi:hypothetical protein